MTAALTFRFCSHTCSYVSSGNDGPFSAWHMTQCLFRMLTISRSNSTVVATVPCGDAVRDQQTAAASTTTPKKTDRDFVPLLCCDDIEGEGEGMNAIAPAKLRPRPVPSRLRHQALERHIGPAAQCFEVRAWSNRKHPRHSVVVWPRDDVERVRMHVLRHVLAHDQRVTERAYICL